MRIGDVVTYVDAAGHVVPARVAAVVGSGPSGYKALDLITAASETVPGVLHVGDAPHGPCWCREGDPLPTPAPEPPIWPDDDEEPARRTRARAAKRSD